MSFTMTTQEVMELRQERFMIRQQRFMQLPRELQLTILRFTFEPEQPFLVYQRDYSPDPIPLCSPHEQLKPIRLVCRLFHDAVTPIIFASIHLHANELSLRRAENIANSSLAHHVREIVHHEGTYAGGQEDKAYFLGILNSHRRRQDYPKHYYFSADDNEMYTNYLQEVQAGSDPRIFEIDRMARLLRKLPKCVSITSLSYERDWCGPIPSAYTLRRTGLTYPPHPTEFADFEPIITPCFLSCINQWYPRALNLANFSTDAHKRLLYLLWENSQQKDRFISPTNQAERLAYLRLNKPEYWDLMRNTRAREPDYTTLLKHLLHSSHNLVHLELLQDFGPSLCKSIIPEDGLPKLTSLTFSKGTGDGRWAEPHMYNLIKLLGRTLKHLHFESITLVTFPEPHFIVAEDDGSILRLLFNITSCTNLESCTGIETVTDSKTNERLREHFITQGPKTGKAAILSKVQGAVCGRLSWPENFDMDQLLMTQAAGRLELAQRGTTEAAFIFSAWEDTVDPWDIETGLIVSPDDVHDLKPFDNSLQVGDPISDNERFITSGPSPQLAPPGPVRTESKRSKILKILRRK